MKVVWNTQTLSHNLPQQSLLLSASSWLQHLSLIFTKCQLWNLIKCDTEPTSKTSQWSLNSKLLTNNSQRTNTLCCGVLPFLIWLHFLVTIRSDFKWLLQHLGKKMTINTSCLSFKYEAICEVHLIIMIKIHFNWKAPFIALKVTVKKNQKKQYKML